MTCGIEGNPGGHPEAQGLLTLAVDGKRCAAADFAVERLDHGPTGLELVLTLRNPHLRIVSRWAAHAATGILCRRDTLTNVGAEPVRITGVAARFAFTPGRYTAVFQDSQWGNENVLCRRELGPETLDLACRGGRTAEGCPPYLFLREDESGLAVVFHLVPQGDWRIRVRPSTTVGQLIPQRVVELGPAADGLCYQLAPGQSWELPEILIQGIPEGQPESGAPSLHRYLIETGTGNRRRDLPFVYNTWADATETLDLARLRRQLAAAKEVGCEVFVVDAGWYGLGEESWFHRVGDWRERAPEAFGGCMAEFADEVRAAGLGFGLWLEPERFGAAVPIIAEHPEWFLPTPTGHFFPDLRLSAAYAWIKAQIEEVIARYRPVWLKFDTNTEFGNDGTELASYFQRWDALMADLRTAHPAIVFEGCASGGLRSELGTVRRFDCNHLSDSQNPLDVLRIYAAGTLRLPPGNASTWIVLHPGVGAEASAALTHGPIAWGRQMLADPDFVAAVALLGVAGFGGNLAELPAGAQARVKAAIALYKQNRNFIRGSVAHLLTPLPEGRQPPAWTAIQFLHDNPGDSLLFAFRLDAVGMRRLRLRGLNPEAHYAMREMTGADQTAHALAGRDLMQDGFEVRIPRPLAAQIWLIERVR
jgi:alpha-galactosidase